MAEPREARGREVGQRQRQREVGVGQVAPAGSISSTAGDMARYMTMVLHGGELDKGQVRAWALNRYYYQASIPRKDATLLAQLTDRAGMMLSPKSLSGDVGAKPICSGP